MHVDLRGQHALITGGGRGIGRAITLALAASGADVAIAYRGDADAAEDVAASARDLGVRSVVVRADVGDPAAVRAMVEWVIETFDTLEILVNNAGVLHRAPFLELAPEDWRRVLTTNLDGTFHVGQAVAREMVRAGVRGAIVNVTSVHQWMVTAEAGHYAVSKAAQWALTRQMAYELAPYGIRVNAVAPGLTESDLNRDALADPGYRAKRLGDIPMHAMCRPRDHANAVLYLVSDAAAMVTGEVIGPSGGTPLAGVGALPPAERRP